MRKGKPGEGWENHSCTLNLPLHCVFTLYVSPPALHFHTPPRELVFSTVLGKATPDEEGERGQTRQVRRGRRGSRARRGGEARRRRRRMGEPRPRAYPWR